MMERFGNPTDRPDARIALVSVLLICTPFLGCSDDPSEPGPGPGPGPGGDPYLVITTISEPGALPLHQSPPDWTDDDRWILSTASPGSIVWKHLVAAPDSAVAVTDPGGFEWLHASYTPFGMNDGGVGFFQGLLLGDFGMHLMRADSVTVAGEPAPTVVRRFVSNSVGLPDNQLSSPAALSVSANGRRAVGTWQTTWFMDWQGEDPEPILITRPATGLEQAVDFRLDRSGERVAFVSEGGVVQWMFFNGDEAHSASPGSHPSFSGDGHLLGYLAPSGTDYIVLDTLTNRTTLYAGSSGRQMIAPVLSWSGDRVAFLEKSGSDLALALAELKD